MGEPQRRKSSRQRGSIAVEFGLAMPILTLVLLGGLQLGRAMVTRHRLEDAVSYAARSAAIGNQTNQGVVQQIVHTRLGRELNQCAPLRTETRTVPSAGPGIPPALEVTATCSLTPMFDAIPAVDTVQVVVAMPLPQ